MRVENVTARFGVLTLAGPSSRATARRRSPTPTAAARRSRFFQLAGDRGRDGAGAERCGCRSSASSGYELHHPLEYQRHIYEQLLEAGEPLGLVDFGYRALDSMRLEKAYRMWGSDLSLRLHAARGGHGALGMLRQGRSSAASRCSHVAENGGPQRRLACLVVDADGADAHGFEPVRDGDQIVGFVTSGGYGFRVQRSIALSYLPRHYCETGTELTVEILGTAARPRWCRPVVRPRQRVARS